MIGNNRHKILLIVPCYNEGQNISGIHEELCHLNLDADTLFINDGSTDNTSLICRRKNIPIVQLSNNIGIGGAVQTGMRYAIENDYDLCIQLDGDGQHPPNQIPLLLEAYNKNNANLVIGSRFLDIKTYRSDALRRFGIRIISGLLLWIYRLKVTDPTSGFRLIDRKALRVFSENYPYDFPEPISIVIAHENNLGIYETSVSMRKRRGGKSSIAGFFKPLAYMLRVVLYIILLRMGRHF